MIPAHALRNGGLSRRGFLRALGVTACTALVPGLGLSACKSAAERFSMPPWVTITPATKLYGSRITMENILKAKAILEANDVPVPERFIYHYGS